MFWKNLAPQFLDLIPGQPVRLPQIIFNAGERELEGIEALVLVSRYAILQRQLADPWSAPWDQTSVEAFHKAVAQELVDVKSAWMLLVLAHGAESKLSRFIISIKCCYKFSNEDMDDRFIFIRSSA